MSVLKTNRETYAALFQITVEIFEQPCTIGLSLYDDLDREK